MNDVSSYHALLEQRITLTSPGIETPWILQILLRVKTRVSPKRTLKRDGNRHRLVSAIDPVVETTG